MSITADCHWDFGILLQQQWWWPFLVIIIVIFLLLSTNDIDGNQWKIGEWWSCIWNQCVAISKWGLKKCIWTASLASTILSSRISASNWICNSFSLQNRCSAYITANLIDIFLAVYMVFETNVLTHVTNGLFYLCQELLLAEIVGQSQDPIIVGWDFHYSSKHT